MRRLSPSPTAHDALLKLPHRISGRGLVWGRPLVWGLGAAMTAFLPFSVPTNFPYSSSLIAEAKADPLAEARAGSVVVQLVKGATGTYAILLKGLESGGEGGIPNPKIMIVKNPMRLVIDVPGLTGTRSQTFRLRDKGLQGLRLAVFGDGTRIVCDLNSDAEPHYVWQRDPVAGTVIVKFSVEAQAEREVPKPTAKPVPTEDEEEVIEEQVVPQSTPTPKLTPTPKPTVIPTPTPKPSPKQTPPPEVEEPSEIVAPPLGEKDAQSAKALLQSIAFKRTGGTNLPAVVFGMKGLDSFVLNKIRDGLYELRLPNTAPETESLLLPGMPPENFERIEMVVSKYEQGTLVVKIFVGDGVTLLPFTLGKDLWVKATGSGE